MSFDKCLCFLGETTCERKASHCNSKFIIVTKIPELHVDKKIMAGRALLGEGGGGI